MAGNQTAEENTPLNQKNLAKHAYATVAPDTTASKLKKQISEREAARNRSKPKLNLFNKLSLTYINVVNYTQRRALYPFAIFFSN